MAKIKNIRWISLYYSVSIYVGIASAVLGPSLLYLVDQTNSSLTELSIIFPVRAGSYMIGSWLAGLLFDRYRGHKLLTIGLVVMGITLGMIPGLENSIRLVLLILAMGLAMGLVDVGCNTLLFRIQSIKIGPVMNGLHFFYGLGSFLAPLILAGSLQIQDSIQWGYWGLGLFSILVLGQVFQLSEPTISDSGDVKSEESPGEDSSNQAALVWIIALFFFAFVGVEIGYGDWLYTYTIKSLLAAEEGAILLVSVYWGAFTVGRLISIPLAAKIKSITLLLGDLIGAFLGLGLVLIFPTSSAALWCGTIILGISLASIFPTALTFAESIMPMTSKTTSIFFISGSVGTMVVPWVIGRYVEEVGPIFIIRVLFIILVFAGIMFGILPKYTKTPAVKLAGD